MVNLYTDPQEDASMMFSDDYASPNRFGGTIKKVIVSLGEPTPTVADQKTLKDIE